MIKKLESKTCQNNYKFLFKNRKNSFPKIKKFNEVMLFVLLGYTLQINQLSESIGKR